MLTWSLLDRLMICRVYQIDGDKDTAPLSLSPSCGTSIVLYPWRKWVTKVYISRGSEDVTSTMNCLMELLWNSRHIVHEQPTDAGEAYNETPPTTQCGQTTILQKANLCLFVDYPHPGVPAATPRSVSPLYNTTNPNTSFSNDISDPGCLLHANT